MTRRYVIPKTYAKLGREPGAQGYWDASFASTANSFVTAGLAIHAFMRSPSLMTSEVHRTMHARDIGTPAVPALTPRLP